MKLEHITVVFLGLLVATSSLAARAAAEETQEPAAREAVAKVEPGVQLTFGVTGLTQDNLTKVKESLQALASQTYACDMCKSEQDSAGKCAACKVDLVAKKRPLFQSVTPSADLATMKLALDPANAVHLTEIERTLEKNAVKIDASKLPIPGKASLVFHGGSAEVAPTIEKALKDAKLFDDAKAAFDADTKDIRVKVQAGATPPTRAKLASSLEAAGVKLPLADVVWGHKLKKPAG